MSTSYTTEVLDPRHDDGSTVTVDLANPPAWLDLAALRDEAGAAGDLDLVALIDAAAAVSPRYRVTLTRPSHSKCPNAWARIEGDAGWLSDTFTVEHGTRVVLGGDLRRKTRTDKIVETITIDEVGSWPAWASFGRISIEIDAE